MSLRAHPERGHCFFCTVEEKEHPLEKPTRRPYDPAAGEEGYWSRPTLLGWYSGLGAKGKLAWFGGILVGANGVALLFGFFWPRILILGGALLLVGLLMPRSSDD